MFSHIAHLNRDEFQAYRRNDKAPDVAFALDELNIRTLEVATMIRSIRQHFVSEYSGGPTDTDALSAMLTATLGLIATMADPHEVIHAELARLTRAAAQSAQ